MTRAAHYIYAHYIPHYGRVAVLAGVFFIFMSLPTFATTDCLIPYEEFEDDIPHIDIPACPHNTPNDEQGFCRLVFNGAEGFIFSFLYNDEHGACLTDIQPATMQDFFYRP